MIGEPSPFNCHQASHACSAGRIALYVTSSCLLACMHACMHACMPACLPACPAVITLTICRRLCIGAAYGCRFRESTDALRCLASPLLLVASALPCQSRIQPNLTESNLTQLYTRAANPRTGEQRACMEEYDHPHGHRMFYISRGWPFGQPRHDQFSLAASGGQM